jgi:hypothetical protein
VPLLLVEELLLQELQALVDGLAVCKLLKIPDMSGDLISLFASLRFFEEIEVELSLRDSSEAVEVEEFLRTGSHSSS